MEISQLARCTVCMQDLPWFGNFVAVVQTDGGLLRKAYCRWCVKERANRE